jgi:hypothetical protein
MILDPLVQGGAEATMAKLRVSDHVDPAKMVLRRRQIQAPLSKADDPPIHLHAQPQRMRAGRRARGPDPLCLKRGNVPGLHRPADSVDLLNVID